MDFKKIAKILRAEHLSLDGKNPLDIYRKRKEIQKMKRAVCIYLKNSEGLILAVSRKHDPNDFGLPGGKVDPGETEEQAVIREMKEETGLKISNLKKVFQHTAEREYWTSCWTGEVSGKIQTSEKGVVSWVVPEVLIKGCFGEYNKKLFDAIKKGEKMHKG